ncbi:unnamed protein product, partial [Staurois parvus]
VSFSFFFFLYVLHVCVFKMHLSDIVNAEYMETRYRECRVLGDQI